MDPGAESLSCCTKSPEFERLDAVSASHWSLQKVRGSSEMSLITRGSARLMMGVVVDGEAWQKGGERHKAADNKIRSD